MALTPKQEKFAQKYVECGNASEAYRCAYDVGENTTDESVHVLASNVKNDVKVSLRIKEIRNNLSDRHDVTRDSLIKLHMRMIEAWEELWLLGQKEGRSAEETKRFYLLRDLCKGSDYSRSIKYISEMTGLDKPKADNDKPTDGVTVINIIEHKADDKNTSSNT
jgi:hypothetical protein